MPDIKITIIVDASVHAPNIHEDARWLEDEGCLYYPLSGKPRQASPGCWVYFIRGGALVARAKATEFVWVTKKLYSYRRKPMRSNRWHVKYVSPLVIAKRPIRHRGFQGFRYVTSAEKRRFESAF